MTQRRSSNGHRPEQVILAALKRPCQRRWEVEESLEELTGLTQAAGASVVATIIQERETPSPSYYFGKGKVEELADLARDLGINLLISDDPLTPGQERNLHERLRIKVIDRTALILDIFAQRARTSEGKLQVELAQLSYLLPRLVGQWSHLERLGGGIGTRGPGETQLESDRRIIRRRIQKITRELGAVTTHRQLVRTHRSETGLPVVALVGYTNAGKTTLLNRLAGSSFPVADQLFVTLDPATRLVATSGHQPFILTDTVGFIRKLPHQLVAAFKATLEELKSADLLLHVVDASHPRREEQVAAVNQLLEELDVQTTPTLLVLNKIDRLDGQSVPVGARGSALPISAETGKGVEGLLDAIGQALRPTTATYTLRIPYRDGSILALLYEHGRVLQRRDSSDGSLVEVELPRHLAGLVLPYQVRSRPPSTRLLNAPARRRVQ